ncbi:hypothetical protein B0H13DRAFT_1868010 [Mycena leptocephala]|nr:hypothetical protein B0H13DRAFT_1868010 [Mycena leptocephala]
MCHRPGSNPQRSWYGIAKLGMLAKNIYIILITFRNGCNQKSQSARNAVIHSPLHMFVKTQKNFRGVTCSNKCGPSDRSSRESINYNGFRLKQSEGLSIDSILSDTVPALNQPILAQTMDRLEETFISRLQSIQMRLKCEVGPGRQDSARLGIEHGCKRREAKGFQITEVAVLHITGDSERIDARAGIVGKNADTRALGALRKRWIGVKKKP